MLNVNDGILSKASEIKLVLFDLVGTLICQDSSENCEELKKLAKELKKFSTRLKKRQINVALISGSDDPTTVDALGKIKNCELFFASLDKLKVGEELVTKYQISFKNVLFIGDELFDLPLLQKAGLSLTTQDARREVRRKVDYILPLNCGIAVLNFIEEEILS